MHFSFAPFLCAISCTSLTPCALRPLCETRASEASALTESAGECLIKMVEIFDDIRKIYRFHKPSGELGPYVEFIKWEHQKAVLFRQACIAGRRRNGSRVQALVYRHDTSLHAQ
jgi:hypothetical protein